MKDKAFIGASVVAAVAASLCCILPIIFAVAGAGIIGASAFFAAWRPYLPAVTALLLAAGFYFAYRKPKHACEPGSACEVPSVNKKGRTGLWIATAFVGAFAAFPTTPVGLPNSCSARLPPNLLAHHSLRRSHSLCRAWIAPRVSPSRAD